MISFLKNAYFHTMTDLDLSWLILVDPDSQDRSKKEVLNFRSIIKYLSYLLLYRYNEIIFKNFKLKMIKKIYLNFNFLAIKDFKLISNKLVLNILNYQKYKKFTVHSLGNAIFRR